MSTEQTSPTMRSRWQRLAWVPIPQLVEQAWRSGALLANLRQQTLLWWLLRYGLGVVAVAVAVASRTTMNAWVGQEVPPYITFYPAVMAVALLGGWGPGLLATSLAGLVTAYGLLPPVGQLAVASPADRLGLAIFTGMCLFMSLVAELYRHARRTAAAYDKALALRETLREKEFLSDLFEHTSQPFAVGYPDGRLGRLNHAYEQLTGYTAAELRTLDWSTALTPPEWRVLERQKIQELDRTGQPVRYEKEYIRKDGSRVPIELLVHLVRDAEGKPEYYYAFIADITERRLNEQAERAGAQHLRRINAELQAANTSLRDSRSAALNLMDDALAARRRVERVGEELRQEITERKRAEEALRVGEQRYRTLFESMQEGFYLAQLIFDDHGTPCDFTYLDVNPAFEQIMGLPRDQIIGRRAKELVPTLTPGWLEVFGKVHSTGEPAEYDSYSEHFQRHFDAFVFQPAPGQFAVLVTDITERMAAEEARQQLLDAERAARGEMERANRTKDEFLATVSHELRSPLGAILGWTGLLRRKKTDPDHALGVIERSAHALTQLIEDMLDMGRIMSGKVRLEIQEVEPRSLVVDVVDGVRPAAETKRISLHEHYEAELGSLRCDPARIRQVLSNLLTNALKFTSAGGSIHIYLRPRGDRLQLIVRDTGQGISSDFLPHLFDKFLQAEASTTRKHGGLGLGLAIVKQIVELHEGSIRAASAGEGKGAAFSVTMPRYIPRSLPGGTSHALPGDGQELLELPTGMDVLLIDDDPDALAVVSRVLTESRANVIVANSAEEGLRCFQQRRPKLVVSDISMPQEDGYSLIRKIRAMEGPNGHTLCVALTALARREDRQKALSLGFDEHLSKLTDPTTVVHTLRKLVIKSALDQFKTRRATGPVEPTVADPSRPPGHILLAEDNETIAHMLKLCLEDEGYRVSAVATVAAGLEVASTQPVDLLLSDCRLKDGTGWDLMAALGETRSMPGIMMSGHTDQVYQDKSKQAGFAEYLTKPVDVDELIGAIARVSGIDSRRVRA